jgi:hypothetical protein
MTTEHFVLQGARSSTIAESSGRANMFLAAVSGGLVALGLVATASSVGTAFYAFGLVLLPTSTCPPPATPGTQYLVERGLTTNAERPAIIHDYPAKADRLGYPPMHGWI